MNQLYIVTGASRGIGAHLVREILREPDAVVLGISRQHLHDILSERKPVSPAVAVRLGKLFGDGAGVWVRMQAAYDTWHAERSVDVSGIETLKVA